MHIEIGQKTKSSNYTRTQYGDTIEITKVNSEKYLGVHIDEKLNFSMHVQKAASKANQTAGIVFRSFTYMSPTIFVTL